MQLGECFLQYHLWIVISDPNQNPDKVIIAYLTTVKGRRFEDLSCVFDAGEHPFITRESAVAYSDIRIHTDSYLDDLVLKPHVKLQATPFSLTLLDRIHAGAVISQHIPLDCLAILRQQGFVT
ncbi:MAG: hypothetical protein ACRC8S_03605 [Fimbriiglobus sp.]